METFQTWLRHEYAGRSNADIMESQYAKTNPEAALRIVRIRSQARTMGTKVGYMSSIRHYIRFAMNNGVDPAILPASPLFLQFWISDRAGAAVNVSSLTTWTAAIGWWHELGHAPKTYQDDRDYRLFIRNITKQYKRAPKKRLPIRIHHLIGLVKALKVVPGNYDKCDFDDLVTVCRDCTFSIQLVVPSESPK